MRGQVFGFAVVAALVALAGCGKSQPRFTDVSGVVLIDGQPLPKARVQFVPELPGFGAEVVSYGITDDQGHFTLTRGTDGPPGAAIAKHHVLVSELPTPGEYRSPDPVTQAKYAEYKSKLKNRPIPEGYGAFPTAIEVEVKPDQKEYRIELRREK